MPKINRGYVSPLEFLHLLWVEVQNPGNVDEDLAKLRTLNYPRYNPSENMLYSMQFMNGLRFIWGGFQPLADIYKDFVDTFKPYKSKRYILRDFLQPLYGLENIARGIGCLIVAPLFFLVGNVATLLYILGIPLWGRRNLGRAFRGALNTSLLVYIMPIAWILDGGLRVFRGITQIVATPLSWFKVISREIITRANGAPEFKDSERVKQLLKDYDSFSPEEYLARKAIEAEVNRKFYRAKRMGQSIDIDGIEDRLNPFEAIKEFIATGPE